MNALKPRSKMTIVMIFAVTVILFLFGCSSDWPPVTELLHTDYDQYTPGYPANDFGPKVATDGLGSWIAVWFGNSASPLSAGSDCPTGNVKDNHIYTSLSTDNGKSWSFCKCMDAGDDNGNPSIATDGKGNWAMVWMADKANGNDYDIYIATCTTSSWSLPSPSHPWGLHQALNTNAAQDNGYDMSPDITWDGKGKWIAVWSSDESYTLSNSGNDYDILFSTSADGIKWSDPKSLNTNASVDQGVDSSPCIASDGQGNLIVVWCSNTLLNTNQAGPDYDILYSRSSDGTTWTSPQALNTNASNDTGNDENPCAAYGNGRWNVAWQSTESLGNTVGTDYDIFVTYRTGNGTNWQSPTVIWSYMAKDKGNDYSPHIAYGQNKWFVVWESDEDVGTPPNNSGTDYDIFMAQSYDDGTTWYQNGVVHDSGYGDSAEDKQAYIATDKKNHWIVVWTSEYSGPSSKWGLDFDILKVRF